MSCFWVDFFYLGFSDFVAQLNSEIGDPTSSVDICSLCFCLRQAEKEREKGEGKEGGGRGDGRGVVGVAKVTLIFQCLSIDQSQM